MARSPPKRMYTHQLIFVEEGNEFVRDYLVKTIQEALYLFTDGLGHAHFCHQLHILTLHGGDTVSYK